MSDERLTIAADPREITGKKVKKLRRDGITPAVIYGASEPVNIQLDTLALFRILRESGQTNLIDVQIGSDTRTVLARDIQQHVTRGDLIHVDFIEVDLKTAIVGEAELIAVGESGAMAEGTGTITFAMRTVEIEALPEALVSEIEVDISLIATTDDVITVADLKAPEGVEILSDPETTVASFAFDRAGIEEEEEEGEEGEFDPAADSVEVISKGKDEEEDF
ncbi:MAG: 50S ribosomal protein L25 [Chloroflexi bacterium]|nr:MAG: 50S ribosomal protein L25 [Chloroflexota bacterium]